VENILRTRDEITVHKRNIIKHKNQREVSTNAKGQLIKSSISIVAKKREREG